MAGKRKRNRSGRDIQVDNKRQRISGTANSKDPVIKSAVLTQYYPEVLSLREYLLSKLPTTSKIRKKKILSVGRNPQISKDSDFSNFLDETLVGVSKHMCNEVSKKERQQQWVAFSQRIDTSDSNIGNTSALGGFSQVEIVDFAIWLLVNKSQASDWKSRHLLCQGFRKEMARRMAEDDQHIRSNIPGIISTHLNNHVITLKASPWPQVLALMGREGEKTMIDLILDCGVFIPVKNGCGTFHQLSGQPLGDLQVLPEINTRHLNLKTIECEIRRSKENSKALHTPSSITFVRNRIMYARSALNAQGNVQFGFRHIHILNRSPHPSWSSDTRSRPHQNTVRVMMYIFPRQFGLHSVFTHNVNKQETVQPFKDYTLREDDIHEKYPLGENIKVPKRLRGKGTELVEKLQLRHSRCPYKELINYYCPHPSQITQNRDSILSPDDTCATESTAFRTQQSMSTLLVPSVVSSRAVIPPVKPTLMDQSTPVAMVSAFCRAVLLKLVPSDFWGSGDVHIYNQRVFLRNVNRFIRLRRFESLTLHEILRDMKISDIEWLSPPLLKNSKMSRTDFNKRFEIFQEFMYYIFDSILIPLIRTNFHVTESNVHKYRLFFFRQDVWKSLADPAFASLKISMFEELRLDRAQHILDSRALGFSQVRLLPKATGVRPIMNLKRRPLRKGYKNILSSSINSILTPIFNVLTYEKMSNPSLLGSSIFSIGDLYSRLRDFKAKLNPAKPLYFCFVDVKSAFDTIPQDAIIKLISTLPSKTEYRIQRHAEIKPSDTHLASPPSSKPIRKFANLAHTTSNQDPFTKTLNSLSKTRKNTVFVESITTQRHNTSNLLTLLSEHITQNLVKIGKKFYRQRTGIPQGSVISSLLCNYFYADLEAKYLSFLNPSTSILNRLQDDFLLITTEREDAKRFLNIMHKGVPEYGVQVGKEKTLVNFEVSVDGGKLKRLVAERGFPFCGSLIDVKTLDLKRDRKRAKDISIEDALTVEYSKIPGKTFHRKVLNTFKIQSHPMYLDTSHNSLNTVLSNMYSAFLETAEKTHAYIRCLPSTKQPNSQLITKAIEDVIELAFVLVWSRGRVGKKSTSTKEGFKCTVKKAMVEWMCLNAFKTILTRKQSRYRKTLEWIEARILRLRSRESAVCGKLDGITKKEALSLLLKDHDYE